MKYLKLEVKERQTSSGVYQYVEFFEVYRTVENYYGRTEYVPVGFYPTMEEAEKHKEEGLDIEVHEMDVGNVPVEEINE